MISRLTFLLVLVLSVGYFFRILWKRLGPMRTAQSSLSFDHPGRRLWRAFAEVMLQTRVIRDRPVAGFLHALVMWGFFAFAWASIEHLSLGLLGLERAQADKSWYGAFAALWAIAVLAGIVGLAFRRFVLRPDSLGEVSVSSGLVAVLIVSLMATYLVGWRGVEAGTTAWRVNWWLHTLSFLAMLFVIPHSKHLHLVLAPIAIFLRAETTSGIRALRDEDDNDFGMLRFGDLSAKDILDVNTCVECGRCTDVCPANTIGGSLDPKEIILQMQRGLPAGGDVIAGTAAEVGSGQRWVREEDLFQCLSCGACEQACPVGIEHVGAKILDLRRGLVSEGRTHNDRLSDLFTAMERTPHNPWRMGHDVRTKLVEGEKFPIFDGSQQWLFWLGCGNSYDPHGQDVARAMKKILEASELSWGVLERETCCGEPARRAGNEYLYMELSEKVIDVFRGKKVKNIVTCCPHCTRMLDVDYRQNAAYQQLDIRVLHHSELIDELMPDLGVRRERETVTYHDPCYLARGRGITREPRSVLEACGAEVVELRRNREHTFCCGAGGAQLFIADDKAELPGGRVNHQRFEEIVETGARKVAVACPYCPIMLNDAAQHADREDIQVIDIAELVASRMQ